MGATLKARHKCIPMTILATYAPRKGYSHEARKQQWAAIQQELEEIPTTYLTIWGDDANGQLGNRKKQNPQLNKTIGMHTNMETTEEGNGKSLETLCMKHQMIPMNTWRGNPGQTKHD